MVRSTTPTLGPEVQTTPNNAALSHGFNHNLTYSNQQDYSLLPRPDQSLDEKILAIWMTVFAVFAGTSALAWLVLYILAYLKTKIRKVLAMPQKNYGIDLVKIAAVAVSAVAYHLVMVGIWYAIPDASWASAGLARVAAKSARLVVQVEIGVSLVIGGLLMGMVLVLG